MELMTKMQNDCEKEQYVNLNKPRINNNYGTVSLFFSNSIIIIYD